MFSITNLNSFDRVLSGWNTDTDSAFVNSGIYMAMGNGEIPFSEPSVLPDFNPSQSNSSHAWFYCLPRFGQAFIPTQNFATMETLVSETVKNVEDDVSPNVETSSHQKKFLAADQSGDKTAFILCSEFRSPIPCLTSWSPKSECANIFGDRPLGNGSIQDNRPSKNEFDMYQRTDVHSEMHEDTAEINALLYSDEDCYSIEDDEVASTGHSPSTMIKDYDMELAGGSTEEVPISLFKTKKRKLLDDVNSDSQLKDTASFLNCNRCVEYTSDAESRCEGGSDRRSVETGSSFSSKRMQKEKVRDILSVLQSMIPGGKDKDAVMLLDDAIEFLKSLKIKAKLLGLDTFKF